MGDRKKEEKLFHERLRKDSFEQRWTPELEKLIKENPLWSNMKYYSIERKSRKIVLDWFIKECRDKKVLDYCCGNGDDAIFIAQNGASEVFGIDISEISIKNCIMKANEKGVDKITKFLVMDAENLKFDDNYFDIITEYGALHHLDLKNAYSELARVLKPDGKIICVEALGHNKIIHLYRKMTPHLRTRWEVEHILKKKDIEFAKCYFNKIEVLGFFHLATLLAVPFRNLRGFNIILSVLESIDEILLKLPILKWQAWQVVFVLSNPKK